MLSFSEMFFFFKKKLPPHQRGWWDMEGPKCAVSFERANLAIFQFQRLAACVSDGRSPAPGSLSPPGTLKLYPPQTYRSPVQQALAAPSKRRLKTAAWSFSWVARRPCCNPKWTKRCSAQSRDQELFLLLPLFLPRGPTHGTDIYKYTPWSA